jgi:hypothetical protein
MTALTRAERERIQKWFARILDRHGLTHRAMAPLMKGATYRAVGLWASGERPMPVLAQLRAAKVDTALTLARGELSVCAWDPAGRTQLEVMDHVDECAFHAQIAIEAVQRGG